MPVESVASPMLLKGAAFFADPYPVYARLREQGAPVFDEDSGSWLVSRAAQVEMLLSDPRLSKQIPRVATTLFDHSVLFTDAPQQTRLRLALGRAFATIDQRALELRVRALADQLLDRMLETPPPEDGYDMVQALAQPLPVTLLAELLGIPAEDHLRLSAWSSVFLVEETEDHTLTRDRQWLEAGATSAMERYLRTLIDDTPARLGPGLIKALMQPAGVDERLSREELIGNVILLLVAGHETTVNLIGNALYALLRRPALYRRLHEDRLLLGGLIEETLRFESPVQRSTFRVAREEIELGGVRIACGAQITALLGSANRDPRAVAEPERFDPERAPNRHIAFGFGPHRCIGTTLARVETRVALACVLDRMPRLELVTEPLWKHNSMTRSLRHLRARP